MSDQPLEDLLERLAVGDDLAAEKVFRTYEPYLRMVVRRQISPDLRAKFDSLDVVQSVFIRVLEGCREGGWQFSGTEHLRAFLIRLTRHRFIDRLRRHRRVLEHEQQMPEDEQAEAFLEATPPAQAILEADELWNQLLELCPPAHRELLRLKREGACTGEVAASTGLHEGSVRRILGDLAARLSRRGGGEGSPCR